MLLMSILFLLYCIYLFLYYVIFHRKASTVESSPFEHKTANRNQDSSHTVQSAIEDTSDMQIEIEDTLLFSCAKASLKSDR